MATTSQVRYWWRTRRCDRGDKITLFGKAVYLQPEAHDAGRAIEMALYDYGTVVVLGSHRNCPTGIAGKTCQQSGKNCSIHNYSLAFDFDPFKYGNPHLYRKMTPADWAKTKFTKAQVRRIEAIRTNNGKQVWRWLGELIGDTMHWEITCSPADLATGIDWSTVEGYIGDSEGMRVDSTSPEKHVAELQHVMGILGQDNGAWNPFEGKSSFDGEPFKSGEDGDWGSTTVGNINALQTKYDYPIMDYVDDFFWSVLIQRAYEVSASGLDPVARAAAATAQNKADKAFTLANAQKSRLDNV